MSAYAQMRARMIAQELLSPITAGGDSWKWQLRDRLGQFMDMHSDVSWLERGQLMRGYIVGSNAPDTAIIDMVTTDRRVTLPTSRLTALGPPPGAKKVPAPAKPTTPKIPRDLAALSPQELERLWRETRDNPNVPLRTFLRVSMAALRRGVKIDQHTWPPAGALASGAPAPLQDDDTRS